MTATQERVLRRRSVEEITGLPRSTIYALMERNAFPRPIPLGPKSVGWLASDIAKWTAARIAERDAKAAVGQVA